MSSVSNDMSSTTGDMSFISMRTSACRSYKWEKKQKEAKKSLTTPRCSRVVPHPSTNRAQSALACEFGWDRAYYTWYGRKRTWDVDSRPSTKRKLRHVVLQIDEPQPRTPNLVCQQHQNNFHFFFSFYLIVKPPSNVLKRSVQEAFTWKRICVG